MFLKIQYVEQFTPGFYLGSCCSIFSFLCTVLYIIVYPFRHSIVCPSVFCVLFCRSLFILFAILLSVHLYSVYCFVDHCLSFSPFYCLSFFDFRLLITPLVSSNFSYCTFEIYNPNLWYHIFYDTLYSCAISTSFRLRCF